MTKFKRATSFTLLAVSLVPVILAGRPIYHCRTTGWDGIACCIQVEARESSCCKGCDPVERPGCGVESQACDCCDVTFLQVNVAPGKKELDFSPLTAVTLFHRELAELGSLSKRLRTGNAGIARAGPAKRPLYLLHSVLLV